MADDTIIYFAEKLNKLLKIQEENRKEFNDNITALNRSNIPYIKGNISNTFMVKGFGGISIELVDSYYATSKSSGVDENFKVLHVFKSHVNKCKSINKDVSPEEIWDSFLASSGGKFFTEGGNKLTAISLNGNLMSNEYLLNEINSVKSDGIQVYDILHFEGKTLSEIEKIVINSPLLVADIIHQGFHEC